MHIPAIVIYKSYDYFLQEKTQTDPLGFSMGNLGFSESKCVIDTIDFEGIELVCSTGSILSVSDFGVTT